MFSPRLSPFSGRPRGMSATLTVYNDKDAPAFSPRARCKKTAGTPARRRALSDVNDNTTREARNSGSVTPRKGTSSRTQSIAKENASENISPCEVSPCKTKTMQSPEKPFVQNEVLILCTQCDITKPSKDFTKAQLKRLNPKPKCRPCASAYAGLQFDKPCGVVIKGTPDTWIAQAAELCKKSDEAYRHHNRDGSRKRRPPGSTKLAGRARSPATARRVKMRQEEIEEVFIKATRALPMKPLAPRTPILAGTSATATTAPTQSDAISIQSDEVSTQSIPSTAPTTTQSDGISTKSDDEISTTAPTQSDGISKVMASFHGQNYCATTSAPEQTDDLESNGEEIPQHADDFASVTPHLS